MKFNQSSGKTFKQTFKFGFVVKTCSFFAQPSYHFCLARNFLFKWCYWAATKTSEWQKKRGPLISIQECKVMRTEKTFTFSHWLCILCSLILSITWAILHFRQGESYAHCLDTFLDKMFRNFLIKWMNKRSMWPQHWCTAGTWNVVFLTILQPPLESIIVYLKLDKPLEIAFRNVAILQQEFK